MIFRYAKTLRAKAEWVLDYDGCSKIPRALVIKWVHWFQVNPIDEAKRYLKISRKFGKVSWSIWLFGIAILAAGFWQMPDNAGWRQWKQTAIIGGGLLAAGFLIRAARYFLRIKRCVVVYGKNAKRKSTYEGDTYLFLHIVQSLQNNLDVFNGPGHHRRISTKELAEIVECTLAEMGAKLHENEKLIGQHNPDCGYEPSYSWRNQQDSLAVFEETHQVLYQLRLAQKSVANEYVVENN